jgi:hypothetical protein
MLVVSLGSVRRGRDMCKQCTTRSAAVSQQHEIVQECRSAGVQECRSAGVQRTFGQIVQHGTLLKCWIGPLLSLWGRYRARFVAARNARDLVAPAHNLQRREDGRSE